MSGIESYQIEASYGQADGSLWDEDALSSLRRMNPRDGGMVDAAIAGGVTLLFLLTAAMLAAELRHWLLLPSLACGALTGKDLVAWLRGRMDIFDVKAAIAALMYNGTVVAPALYLSMGGYHDDNPWRVTWRLKTLEMWQFWLGVFLTYVFVLVSLYLASMRLGFAGKSPRAEAKTWRVPKGISLFLGAVILASVVAWIVYLTKVGGFRGMDETRYQLSVERLGTGPLLMLAGSTPFMVAFGIIILRGRARQTKGGAIGVVLLLMLVLAMQLVLVGGLGSRTKILGALFAAMAMIHFFWRPFRRKELLVALIPLFLFLQVYSLYKDYGLQVFRVFSGDPVVREYRVGSRRSLAGSLVGDLSRSYVQAGILQATIKDPDAYEYAFGRTYANALIEPIPHALWSRANRPTYWRKGWYGWQLAAGGASYSRHMNVRPNVLQYGLFGEAMFNLGVVGPLLMAPVFGFLVGRLRRLYASLQPRDARLLITSILVPVAMSGFLGDFDNVIRIILYTVAVPAICVAVVSHRRGPAANSLQGTAMAAV